MDEARPLISNLLELAVNWLMKLTFQVYRQRSTEKVRPRVSCSSPKPNVSELTFWSEDLSDNYDSGQVLIAPRRLALVVVDSTNSVERNPMYTVVGPVLTRKGGYAFDCWTPENGLSPGYTYHRVQDALYARNVEIRSHNKGSEDHAIACNTVDDFARSTTAGSPAKPVHH